MTRHPRTAQGRRAGAALVGVHATVIAGLTASVLLTDDRAQTWTRLSELLLAVTGLPWSMTLGVVAAVAAPVAPDWAFDVLLITAAWVNVGVGAVLLRQHPVAGRRIAEVAGLLALGVGVWGALLSWSPEADWSLAQSVAAALSVLVVVAVLSARRPPVRVAVCVGGGAWAAVSAHAALSSAFWIFLAVPLLVVGGGAVAGAATVGAHFRRPGTSKPAS